LEAISIARSSPKSGWTPRETGIQNAAAGEMAGAVAAGRFDSFPASKNERAHAREDARTHGERKLPPAAASAFRFPERIALALNVGIEVDAALLQILEHRWVEVGAPEQIEFCAEAVVVEAPPFQHALEAA